MPASKRLRPHPEDRLDSALQLVDLPATAAALRNEPHPSIDGHRQMAVFRRGPVTLISFVFEPGGLLKEHEADGVVTIHVISGHLRVVAEDETHELTSGRLVAIGPHIPHTVSAVTASEMLLTVHRGVT